MGLIRSIPENCRFCYACIRICPVKALRSVEEEYFDLIDERCINCGLCVEACTQSALLYENSITSVIDILKHKQAVAVISTEYVASFYPYKPEVVIGALEELGFIAVEDSILAEEIVAREYLNLMQKSDHGTMIRSTCPVINEYVEKFYPDLIPYLTPVVSPMVAAGRLYKELYGHDVAVVYITPCIAAKAEAKEENVRDAVDAVLTFSELKELFRQLEIDLDVVEPSASEKIKPVIIRKYSTPGGFPRKLLSDRSLLDKEFKVAKSFIEFEEIIQGISKNIIKPEIVDTLFCSTCIEGPGMDTALGTVARKKLVEEYYSEKVSSSRRVTLDQLLPRLPFIESRRIFRRKISDLIKPTEEEINVILIQGERDRPENMLDCGSCGYETCYEHAIAIFYGFSNWERCVPYQRTLYSRVLKQLKEASTTDGLTGLYNHRAFIERLEQEFRRAQRYGSELSVMMIDLDGFKQINDSYGHLVGDEVLRKVAEIFKKQMRASDFIARYGGDEFAVILPETSKNEAFAVAEKIKRAFEREAIRVNHQTMSIRFSVGISSYRSDMKSFYDLIEEADRAMYLAKEKGKNRISAYERAEETLSELSDNDLNIEDIEKEIYGENSDF